MEEVWKDIKGYEGFYQASNLGRIQSLDRLIDTDIKYVGKRLQKGKVLSPCISNKGYKIVCLCKYGERKGFLVHRLVAEAFIPNPNNYPIINHKDENKQNNIVWVNEDGSIDYDKSNLEWCTQEYNMNWNGVMKKVGLKFRKTDEEKETNRKRYLELHKEERKKYQQEYHRKHYKPKGTTTKKGVSQYTIEGEHIRDYTSVAEAFNSTGIKHIGCVCNGNRSSAGGYIWKWMQRAS